ncbi:MAG: Gfo/Idh/MocA family oxidoreductase [Candidatus Omnitrophica bacterium]|nr:Gfo/Idh/MocA family oxidoreductase [Candidatus Omnitrophota bacterium]MCM8803427.1 Gfo/Idh/MocA family oxidoreductase [Candidatus Omnitrophota bacterium]
MEIKVGIIGTGRISNAHISSLKKIENVKIASVCDIKKEIAKKKAEELDCNYYLDYKEMIEKENLDCVWICTPADTHTKIVLYCIEKNLPFFLEKPPALKEEECEGVIKKLKEKNIIHSVGFMMRYDPAVEKLKEILKNEKIIFISAEWFWTIPLVDSIKNKEKAGGQIVDQAIHFIDLIRYVFGEIKSVYTKRVRGFFPEDRLYTGDDASCSIFEFENGICGNLLCTYALFPEITRYYYPKIRFICKRKLIEYSHRKIVIITSDRYEEFIWNEDLYFLEDKAFIETLINRDKKDIRSNYFDSVKTLKICLSANQSMEINTLIYI